MARPLPWWQSLPLRVCAAIIGLVSSVRPRAVELSVGPILGRIFLALDLRRWKIVDENLRRCLPELSDGERKALLRANYRHYGILFFELQHLLSPFREHYRRYARRISVLEGYENWKRASDKGKGVIFVSSHLGNWEMMVAAGAMAGIPITMVTRKLQPEWLLRKVEESRLSVGARAAYQPRTLPAIMRALRNGESVGFVIDQYAPPPMGMPARFFGVEVDTLAAVGPLAQRTGAAVVPVSTRRDAEGIVHVVIEPELELGDALQDPAKVTQLLADKVEAWIRATPAQWLWAHRRFKNLKS